MLSTQKMVGDTTFLALSVRIHWQRMRAEKRACANKPMNRTITLWECIRRYDL
jgi:hypothetical protein